MEFYIGYILVIYFYVLSELEFSGLSSSRLLVNVRGVMICATTIDAISMVSSVSIVGGRYARSDLRRFGITLIDVIPMVS